MCRESPCTHCLAPATIQSIPPHPSHYFCKQIPDNVLSTNISVCTFYYLYMYFWLCWPFTTARAFL